MWKRILRVLTTLFSAYSFYQNPVRFIISLLALFLVPYLVYIFWGTIILLLLVIFGIFALYKLITGKKKKWT